MIRVLDKAVFALGLLHLAHHHAQCLFLSSDDAHDCASEFFLKHWTLDLSPSSHPSSYWHQCASHHALNYRRAVFRQGTLLVSLQEVPPTSLSPLPSPDDALDQKTFFSLLREALKKIEPEPRVIFLAHYLEQFPVSEIAFCSACSESAIRQSLYRTRLQLRILLQWEGWSEARSRDLPQ